MIDYEDVLKKQDKEKLVSLLADISKKYPEIENEIRADLGILDEKKEIKEMKQHIRQIIRMNKRQGYINSRGCDTIMSEFDDVIEKCLEREQQGFFEVAYTVLIDIIVQCMKLASTADSSNGTLTQTLADSFFTLNEMAKRVSIGTDEIIKKNLFQAIIRTSKNKAFDGWTDDCYEFLQTGISLVTPQNASKMLKASRDIYEKNCSDYDYRPSDEDDTFIQIKVMLQLGKENEAIALMDKNLQSNNIRHLRVAQAIDSLAYDLAEELVLEKIHSIQNSSYYRKKEWYDKLDMIYTKTNQLFKRIENLKTMVKQSDVDVYPELKQLLIAEGFWEEDYPQLLATFEKTLSPSYYAFILEQEKEWAKLYQLATQYPSFVEYYGKELYKDFPEETSKLSYEWLKELLKEATDRRGYRKAARMILSYAKFGEVETAVEWVSIIKNDPKNKRKTALQDEMNQVLYKLANGV